MYIIYEEYYDIETHFQLVDDKCFTTYEKAEKYLLNGTNSYKQDGNQYELGNTIYYIVRLGIVD